MIEKKVEFSLEVFIGKMSSPSNSTYSNEIYKRVNELHDILLVDKNVPNDYNIFENFTREEIEWYTDALLYWPYEVDENDEGANHLIVQGKILSDINKRIISAKPERKKGFKFI